jgi:hypothetical protein
MGADGALTLLCRRGTRQLPASDLGVSVFSERGEPAVVAASSPRGEAIEQLQFTLGEGPCRDACELGSPVLAPDLRLVSGTRWPGYGPAALDLGVGAVFAFPLQRGAARLGALDVYRAQPGALPEQTFVLALALAEEATETLLDDQERPDRLGNDYEDGALDRSFVVYQAQGMVQVQLGVDLAEALGRLRAHAYAQDRPLHEVAADVVARRLVLEQDS